mmetsp:Transcript_32396/g.53631  ORF Transcript_32396/g.53631 Transcript_32396/m.53631 type:complete len:138 (+) Transcript_32396:31-444(+)
MLEVVQMAEIGEAANVEEKVKVEEEAKACNAEAAHEEVMGPMEGEAPETTPLAAVGKEATAFEAKTVTSPPTYPADLTRMGDDGSALTANTFKCAGGIPSISDMLARLGKCMGLQPANEELAIDKTESRTPSKQAAM